MPELPEVQTVVDSLRPSMLGAVITRVTLHRHDIVQPNDVNLPEKLTGRRVTEITRRGKRIVIALDDGNMFYVHLGMTGRLTIERGDAPIEKHTHATIGFSGTEREMRFRDARRFGGIFWLGANGNSESKIGPEPLKLRPGELLARLARTKRAIKNVLLDQTVLAGLGNIYADEALFDAGIHPLARADRLSGEQVRRLNRAIKLTLRRALRHRGSTLRDYVDANGDAGGFQKLHRVYARQGEPCVRCGRAIARLVLGGRSCHFCPNCQRRRAARR